MKDETILLKSKNQSCSFYPMVLIKIGENYNSLPLPENSIYISDSRDILCLINITFPIQAKYRLGQSQGNCFFFLEIHYDISNSSSYLPIWTYVWGEMTLFQSSPSILSMVCFSKNYQKNYSSQESWDLPFSDTFSKRKLFASNFWPRKSFVGKVLKQINYLFVVIKIKDNQKFELLQNAQLFQCSYFIAAQEIYDSCFIMFYTYKELNVLMFLINYSHARYAMLSQILPVLQLLSENLKCH